MVVSTITAAHLLAGAGGPSLVLVIGVGLLVGLALGLAGAWIRDRLSDRVRSVGELNAQARGCLRADWRSRGRRDRRTASWGENSWR